MIIPFTKYQGTGNDFVIIDQRNHQYIKHQDISTISQICDRKFGVGADGLILLENHPEHDYEMIYFNADGRTSSMCGNGGRCITAFAGQVGAAKGQNTFMAIDGLHISKLLEDGSVSLKMNDVLEVRSGEDFYILDTGSPHYIIFVEDIDDIDIKSQGEAIRYSEEFRVEGINVNFVEIQDNEIRVATYERGVEDETLSCGTGVTAAAMAYILHCGAGNGQHEVSIMTKGGALRVQFVMNEDQSFQDVWLIGKATKVFEGDYLN